MTWGAVAIGVGTVASGYMGSKASGKAAKASAKGADAASQVQWDIYDQSRQDQMPWLGTGQNALKQLAALNGVPYASATESTIANQPLYEVGADGVPTMNNALYQSDPVYRRAWDSNLNKHIERFGHGYTAKSDPSAINTYVQQIMAADPEYASREANQSSQSSGATAASPDYSAFYESPDYKFAFQEGNRAVNAVLAARGLSNSGRAMKELTRYGQGAASQQLNTYRNALAAMAGVGQTTATNLGQQGMQAGQIIGQNTQNAADARASGYLGKSNAWNSAIGQGIGTGAYLYGQGMWGKTA